MNFEAENTSEQLEADELDKMRYWVAAGAFVVNVERKRRHRSRKRHYSDSDPVIQACTHSRTEPSTRLTKIPHQSSVLNTLNLLWDILNTTSGRDSDKFIVRYSVSGVTHEVSVSKSRSRDACWTVLVSSRAKNQKSWSGFDLVPQRLVYIFVGDGK